MKSPEFSYDPKETQNKNENLEITPETYPDKKYWKRKIWSF